MQQINEAKVKVKTELAINLGVIIDMDILIDKQERIQRLINQREERSTYRLGQWARMRFYPISLTKTPRNRRSESGSNILVH